MLDQLVEGHAEGELVDARARDVPRDAPQPGARVVGVEAARIRGPLHLAAVGQVGARERIRDLLLPRADIVFFVTSIDCPLTQTELDLLGNIRTRWQKEVACILAKVDIHPEKDRAMVIDYLQLMDAFASVADYLAVNISSPNTPDLRRLQEPDFLGALLGALRGRLVPTGAHVVGTSPRRGAANCEP